MIFTSDNAGPAAPEILAALADCNAGFAPPYGADHWTERAGRLVRDVFEAPEAAVCLVGTGTAANALSLALLAPPWGAIFCHRHAHVEEDECGAPEFYTGGSKVVMVEGPDGRIDPGELRRLLAFTGRSGVHNVQRGCLSLTNATELGTVYDPGQIAALTAIAHEFGIPVHLDGARLANALVTQGCSPAEATWKAGVDVLSLGGTKNGLFAAEAVVIFDPARAREFELRRKRGGHLVSKHRFLAAQFAAYLADGLWLRLAARANAMARDLSERLSRLPGAELVHPTEGNAVFARWPRSGHRRAFAAGADYYLWPGDQMLEGPPDELLAARLVCNWCTGRAEIEALVAAIRG